MDLPHPYDEQGLRKANRDQRVVHLRGDEPLDGEAVGSLMRLFGQFLEDDFPEAGIRLRE